jgi:ribonuclease HII
MISEVVKLDGLLLNSPLIDFDRRFDGAVCGIDEAGRGCLAGDVFAAAVILDPNKPISGLDDSKKLSEAKRERLYEEITANALNYAIATASVAEIEELNILQAALLAMKRSYEQLNMNVDVVLVDGNKPPAIFGCECVVGGDGKSAAIAAASILAKVARDRYAAELDLLYPEYGFAKHKGYGTRLHTEMIEKHGVLPIHRNLFLRKLFVRKLIK